MDDSKTKSKSNCGVAPSRLRQRVNPVLSVRWKNHRLAKRRQALLESNLAMQAELSAKTEVFYVSLYLPGQVFQVPPAQGSNTSHPADHFEAGTIDSPYGAVLGWKDAAIGQRSEAAQGTVISADAPRSCAILPHFIAGEYLKQLC